MSDSGFLSIEGLGAKHNRKRVVGWLIVLPILLLLFAFSSTLIDFYTDYLWFKHDALRPEIFTKTMQTQVSLWLIGFVAAFLFIYFNMRLALKTDVVFDDVPQGQDEKMAANVLSVLQKFGKLLGVAVAAIVAMGVGTTLSAAYTEYWFFTEGVLFDRLDPIFGKDLSFFVFRLPWVLTMLSVAVSIIVATLLVTVGTYLLNQFLARVAKVRLTQSTLIPHASLLAGLFLIAFGIRMFFSRYEIGVSASEQFTGPGFAETKTIVIRAALGIATVVVGLMTILNGKFGKPWKALSVGFPALLVLGMLGLGVYPAVVTKFNVAKRLTVEKPYAEYAIAETRFAWGLGQIDVRNFDVQSAPTAVEIRDAQSTLAGMRLWDPTIMQKILNERQTLKGYYAFNDVDIDRYMIDGVQRMVMLAPRDFLVAGLPTDSKSWMNFVQVYTHGYGVTMAPVNESSDGLPNFWIKDIPPETTVGIDLDQHRMYFSHYPAGSHERERYVLVPSSQEEFDFPLEGDKESTHEYAGGRGVPVTGTLAKLAYSGKFGDLINLFNVDMSDETRILYRRDIVDRASLVYPMFAFDQDPYIVVLDGRIKWILDAYSVSNRIPYSSLHATPQGVLNYMRNSVKVVIDAYDGEMIAYAILEDEPILNTYRKIFPKLIKPFSDAPRELVEHFRYAEDLFLAQCQVLTQYHVTDPDRFLRGNDAWKIPMEVGLGRDNTQIKPYYVQNRLPGEDKDEFMLIMPFSPVGKDNLIGWIAARCDPADYGKLVLYKFPPNSQTMGPMQMEARFDQDPVIADINRQFNNDQSRLVPGNLLVVPIGSSVMYVEPLFLESRSHPIPELKKVILALQEKVVVADTYEEALKLLFGDVGGPVEVMQADEGTGEGQVLERPDPGVPGRDVVIPPQVGEALALMDRAEAALQSGDLAGFQKYYKEAYAKLAEIEK
ncbi:MAG: UPF0182 family protein [Armatimonadetes bacterium]|nr:UPF0182 family protein [Armatimonadota bacterium]